MASCVNIVAMTTIVMTRGLPASGKTTWAKLQQKKFPGMYKRVNKDDLRAMLDDGVWSKENEAFLQKVRDYIVDLALKEGYSPIVDDTNLHSKHRNQMWKIAAKHNTIVTTKSFDVTVAECIRRDKKRKNSVGESVIRNMATLTTNS